MTNPSPSSTQHRFTNALSRETSPYLLQHAHNPVDWHPWGDEAFDLARATDKPIFLSVGYSTCYWCHVMERQCFENESIAALMNELFVNIKVDREERPDVDEIYMTAVQLISGRGGWPMSVFLTPPQAAGKADRGLKPFYAGTYIPPEPAHGLAGMPQVLQGLSQVWRERRDEVLKQAEQVAEAVRQNLSRVDMAGPLRARFVEEAAGQLLSHFDAQHGGFGGAPKFPQAANLLFLLAGNDHNPSPELSQALRLTLQRMAQGGMYDQIGGGFHRYSTDERWLVPHFEKMLYDNGQLVEVYLAAASSTVPQSEDVGKRLCQRIIEETCDYILREMTDPTGTFWSAQDAEVDSREGDNYLWTPEEMTAALARTERVAVLTPLALELYGLDAGPNFRDPHDADAPARNVPHLPRSLEELAQARGMKLEELLQARQAINSVLLAARNRRKQPGTDDKVLVSWNGMMIAGLAGAGVYAGRFTQAAAKAADCILAHLRDESGGLCHTMRRGTVNTRVQGFLEDYVFLTHGLIALHRATQQQRWLDEAESLTATALERFGLADGGCCDTLADQGDLFVRTRSTHDGAIPSAGSQMTHNLLDLAQLTGKRSHLDRALAELRSVGAMLESRGSMMAHWQHALLRALEMTPENAEVDGEDQAGSAKPASVRRTPVVVAVEPQVVDLSGPEVTFRVTLKIDPDYHLNAHQGNGDEGLLATELILEGGEGLEMTVNYPPGTARQYPFADKPLAVYEKIVTLEATIRRRTKGAGQAKGHTRPRLMLRYQVCTEQSCLEPRQSLLPVRFEL